MVLGINTNTKSNKTVKTVKTNNKLSSAADAAATLKKMNDKKLSGECTFC